MTTLRRAAEMNTSNYDYLGLPASVKSLIAAARALHDAVEYLDLTADQIESLAEMGGDDDDDLEPAMAIAYTLSMAWGLWQELEQRVAPILARELDAHEAEEERILEA